MKRRVNNAKRTAWDKWFRRQRCRSGNDLGVDPARREIQFVGLVARPAAPVAAFDDEEDAELVEVDALGFGGSRVFRLEDG
jgi:hypothetical protein